MVIIGKHNKPIRNKPLLLAIAIATVITKQQTFAAGTALEEVVVTAQKREESLQDTPIAVTAFTATALEDKGIADISEIAAFTPNLVFDTTSPIGGLSSGAAVFIRGIGNTDFSLTTDPGVGTYVDGVYMSRSVGGVLDVLDIERIEVLRGPQGTLFGRNTIGGAINITSRKPADEFQGSVEITGGNRGRQNLRLSLDIPLTDTLRSNIAASSKTRDGYVDRVLVGDQLGDEERLSFRSTLVFEPNDIVDFQISLDHSKVNEASAAATGVGFTTTFPNGDPGGGSVVGYGLFTFNDVAAGLADLAQYVSDPEDDQSFGTGRSGTKIEINGVAFIANYHAENFDIKYTTSFRNTNAEFFADADNSPVSITEVFNPEYSHEQTTHEIQITGTALSDQLKYAAGIYFFEEEGTDNVFVPIFVPFGFPAAVKNFADIDNNSEAAYLQVTWDITDVFSLTGGIRHTRDEKEYAYTQYLAGDVDGNNGAGTPLVGIFPGAVTQNGFVDGYLPLVGNGTGIANDAFEQTTYKFGVDAHLSDGSLLYYSFSQGFKSGGFVLRYVAPVPDALSFEPETLDSHEVGIKWQGFDDRLRINAALFSSEYEDIQVTFFDAGGGPVTANSGTADIQGVELEMTALLSESLKVELGYGYTDAEYTEINPISGLSAAIDQSASLVNTPENTFSFGVEYTLLLGANELVLRTDYTFTDDMFNDSQNSRFLFQDSTEVWNASARLTIDEATDIVLYVDNLTDERFITSGNSNFGLGFHSAVVNPPREYGATVRHRF